MTSTRFHQTFSLRGAMIMLLLAVSLSLGATEMGDTIVNVENAHKVVVKADDQNVEINIKGAGADSAYSYHFLRSTDKVAVDHMNEGSGSWDFGFSIGGKIIGGKKKSDKGQSKRDLCVGGVGFGFVSTPGAKGGVNVDMGESYEIYWDMLHIRHKMPNSKHRIEYGIGLDWRNYRMTGNSRFEKTPTGVIVSPYPVDAEPNYSRAKTFAVTFPLRYCYVWTKHWGISIGAMLNLNTRSSIKSIYRLNGEKVKDFHRGIHANRVTVDFMSTLHYRRLALFVKYSPCRVLDSDFAPSFQPLSVGVGIGL